jgi:hypothetical protein
MIAFDIADEAARPRLYSSEREGWFDISLVAFDIADKAAPVVVIRLQPTVLALERVKAARRAWEYGGRLKVCFRPLHGKATQRTQSYYIPLLPSIHMPCAPTAGTIVAS